MPVHGRDKDTVTFVKVSFQNVIADFFKERELLSVDVEQIEFLGQRLGFQILIHSLIQVLVEDRVHHAKLFLSIKDTVPGFSVESRRSVLKLGPHGEVDALEGKEFVEDWVVIVLLQTRSLELLEVKEVDSLALDLNIVIDALDS